MGCNTLNSNNNGHRSLDPAYAVFPVSTLSNDPDDYFAKGTREHLTFLQTMRVVHMLYPFKSKKDTDLIQMAVDKVIQQLPALRERRMQTELIFYSNTMSRIAKQRQKKKTQENS